jgi:hypothetical protein
MSAHNRYEKDYVSDPWRVLEVWSGQCGWIMKTLPRRIVLLDAHRGQSSHRFGVEFLFRFTPMNRNGLIRSLGGVIEREYLIGSGFLMRTL